MSYQVKTLKEHSEKPNISNNDQHWIFKCAAHLTKDGALTVIQNMIEKKSFKFSSKKNNTLLHYICKLPQTDEVLQFGLKHFDINSKNGETPLFYAIKKQIIPNVIFLLSKGADTSIKTNDTILHIAARTGNKELVKIVFEKNSSLTATNGYTPFDYACINSKSIDLVKMLYSEDILKDKKGFNLSYINTDSGSSTEIINFLISKNFDCKMKDGSTLLHSYCQKSRDLQMIKYLIELGLDVNEQNGNTPLHLLCQNNKEKDIFTYLINSGADVNLQNGNTPLHLCFWYSLPFEIIQVLLNAGADLSIENRMTPLDYNRRSYIPTIILKKFNSYNEDFYGIFQRQEKCDLKIHSKEGSYFVHSSMLKIRIGEDKLNKVAEVLGNRTDEEVKAFIEFIYSGNVNKKISSSVIEEICKEIGINWEEKAYKKGLLRDLKKAYDNRSSADFSIICAETRINVHSVVLLARSGLFREMFLSVNDSSNEVHDYSEKSKEAMEFFINFLYTDKLDPLMTLEKVEEIEDAVEFYRLNPDSSFDDQIEGLKTKFK